MDWENQLQPPHTAEELNGAVIGGVGGMFVKVTTDRENQQQQHPPQTVEELNGAVTGGGGGIVNVTTDRENQLRQQQPPQTAEELNGAVGGGGGGGGGGMFVKVMSDEQMEVLRKQIGVYGVICEQLVHLHKSSQHHLVAGTRLGNLYCDPLITSSGHRINGRQRWTPTPLQLQILERMFDQGNGAPNKQKIKDITFELSQHGEISETNVYNWFQNRRARSKRKQQVVATNYDVESSEVETEVDESSNEKKTTPAEDLISSEPAESFDQLSFYATSSNPRMEQ